MQAFGEYRPTGMCAGNLNGAELVSFKAQTSKRSFCDFFVDCHSGVSESLPKVYMNDGLGGALTYRGKVTDTLGPPAWFWSVSVGFGRFRPVFCAISALLIVGKPLPSWNRCTFLARSYRYYTATGLVTDRTYLVEAGIWHTWN